MQVGPIEKEPVPRVVAQKAMGVPPVGVDVPEKSLHLGPVPHEKAGAPGLRVRVEQREAPDHGEVGQDAHVGHGRRVALGQAVRDVKAVRRNLQRRELGIASEIEIPTEKA